MSRIKQLSIFVENKKGELSTVLSLLSKNELSIKSINLVESIDFGILKVIVDDEEKAKKVLDDDGFSLKITDVFAVEIDDHIGSFGEVVATLSENDINIEYTYTISNYKNGAFIFKVDPLYFTKAVDLLVEKNIRVLESI